MCPLLFVLGIVENSAVRFRLRMENVILILVIIKKSDKIGK